MPELVTPWGRGKPSTEKIQKMADEIRAGRVMPDGKDIPASVRKLLGDAAPAAPAPSEAAPAAPKRFRKTKAEKEAERTDYVVRNRTTEDYPPVTNPATIATLTENYRRHVAWFEADPPKIGAGAMERAEVHYMRIPEELRNKV